VSALKRLAVVGDAIAGRFLSIQHTAYKAERFRASGGGVYIKDDWARAWRADLASADRTATEFGPDGAFLWRAFGPERRKLESGLRLAEWIHLVQVQSVLEIGSGEMITSWAIKGRLPHIRYVATDYESAVVDRCRQTPMLTTIQKDTLDADEVDPPILAQFDLVVAWDVFYAFSTARMEKFLDKIRQAGCRFLMASSQIVGPGRALSYAIKSRIFDYAGQCRAGRLRDHGFKCSLGYYRRLARRAGLEASLVDSPPWTGLTGDCYFFIGFSARR
jgi:predicted nicotinamide N-methyase